MPMVSPASAGSAKLVPAENPLSSEELRKMHAYWRAANYLSVGQIYLYRNPLLREPLSLKDIKPRLLGHWGTTPGLNFVYLHMNRAIKKYDLNAIFICGPGHGGPGMVANTYLEVPIARSIRTFHRTKRGCANCLSSFRFRAECRAMRPRKRRDRSTRAESWAIRLRTLTGRRSITRIFSFAVWWVTAKRKRAPWRRAGIQTNFSIRRATGRCCRSCT